MDKIDLVDVTVGNDGILSGMAYDKNGRIYNIVGVPKGHPAYGTESDKLDVALDVPGGILDAFEADIVGREWWAITFCDRTASSAMIGSEAVAKQLAKLSAA